MDLKARECGLGEANLGKIDRFRYDDKITMIINNDEVAKGDI